MAVKINISGYKASDNLPEDLVAFIHQKFTPGLNLSIKKTVDEIVSNVIKNRDTALLEYTNKFDRMNVKSVAELKVKQAEIDAAYKATAPEVINALEMAAKRISDYHKKQMPQDIDYKDSIGVRLGNIWKPIETVGLYVPGGLASYPSSVLMNAVPAHVAGVKKVVMVVPAPNGKLNPIVLAAAKVAGITDIFKIGGAQAIAALACGTETVPAVHKIVGPGNAYVAEAKRQFSGSVGIDMIAGPSEILVVADSKNNPDWIAADLLSQAEHDSDARSILITDSAEFAYKVERAVEKSLSTLERKDIAKKSWDNNGAIIIAETNFYDWAVTLTDNIAPEHLELALDDDIANKMATDVRNAGAIFLGRYTPEAIGDYVAGPSHVLPTSGNARFSSGLSVYDFLKRVSLIGCTKESFDKLATITESLANEEGLGAHALSISIRK
ncbi:MAG: Histidinol dehydrogenase, prokaryotic-type [Rickettsiaceae bacterium]|jgi:histidinol dehydrogenase|nr:Histidinol dehydrogenase, prokaryotic-type [Rickettsiaceae bacterium]